MNKKLWWVIVIIVLLGLLISFYSFSRTADAFRNEDQTASIFELFRGLFGSYSGSSKTANADERKCGVNDSNGKEIICPEGSRCEVHNEDDSSTEVVCIPSQGCGGGPACGPGQVCYSYIDTDEATGDPIRLHTCIARQDLSMTCDPNNSAPCGTLCCRFPKRCERSTGPIGRVENGSVVEGSYYTFTCNILLPQNQVQPQEPII